MVEVGTDERLIGEIQDTFHRAFRSRLECSIQLFCRRVALGREYEIDQADIRGRHANRRTIQFPLQIRQHQSDRARCAGGGGDHVLRTATGPPQILVNLVEHALIVRIAVDRGHEPTFDPDRVVQDLGNRRQAIGGAAGIRNDIIVSRQRILIDPEDDRLGHAGCRRGDQHLLGARLDMGARGFIRLEKAGAFQHDIDAVGFVGKLRRIPLGGNMNMLAANDQIVSVHLDRTGEPTMCAVVSE